MVTLRTILPFLCVLSLLSSNSYLQADTTAATVEAKNGVVVSVSAPASEVGRDVLKQGGNAVDAAVATAFALAVTWPEAGNLGGGGFMLVHPGGKAEPTFFDYREMAPAAATKDMFAAKKPTSHLLVGVPGTVRGLALAHQRFGKLPWKDLVTPSVKLARDGFVLEDHLAAGLNSIVRRSPDFPELRRVFGKEGGKAEWKAGDRLVQPDLAATLQLIADDGPDAFYTGRIAEQLVAEMKSGGGLITMADLAAYRARERQPLHGTYRGHDVYSAPPPSSGGTALLTMLNILENFDLKKQGRYSPETLHLMTEAMRRAYADRARYLGDPDFVKVPAQLISKDAARKWAATIDRQRATPSADVAPELKISEGGDSTTHFSVVDRDGMAVANTYTLEQSYGGRVVVKGAGFLLNNEMGDFNPKPGVTTRTGLIGTEPNQIAPGKRMLSSMTPTLVLRDGNVLLVTGSPGGRTIINTVLNVVLNVMEFEMSVREAVDSPRMHHQWFPDQLRVEATLLKRHEKAVVRLRELGHEVSDKGTQQGDAHSIWIDPKTGLRVGAADQRRHGRAAGY